ncbi:MAG: response regulator [Lachnospiraceae bacterium]|nr:response regulator [Lachnospiraceae bacterium]
MATVLIAEDEYLVRTGLRMCLEWEKNGFTLLDDAVDGIDAYKKIKTEHPDILLLDIKMPRMDGLELLKKLREENNPIHVIILSCLDDFEHVRTAFRYGIFDYINKLSITPVELLRVLSRIPIEPGLTEGDKPAKPAVEDPDWQILKKMIRGVTIDSKDLRRLPRRGAILVISAAPRNDGSTIEPHLLMTISGQQLKSNTIASITSYNEKGSVVILLPSPENAVSTADILYRQLQMTLDTACTIGISAPYDGTEAIMEAYRSACLAEEFIYWERPGSVIDCSTPTPALSHEEKHRLLDRIRAAILLKSLTTLTEAIDEVTELCRTHTTENREHYGKLLLSILDLIPRNELNDNFYTVQTAVLKADTYREAHDSLIDYAASCYHATGFSDTGHSAIVTQALRYVISHPEKVVTLSEAARNSNVSESYLSQLFKKETGENFNTYIHHLKIDQAKELLKSGMLIYEVCDRIGFENPNYFAKLFRRYTGQSPNEYKRSNVD